MSSLENALRAELVRIDGLRAKIIEELSPNYIEGSNPDLWRRSDSTYILMPLTESRSRILLALALERNTNKRG